MRRIAHRPRYRNTRHTFSLPKGSRREFFRTRWTYRRQTIEYEKRPLGASLAFIPLGYRFVRGIFVPGM